MPAYLAAAWYLLAQSSPDVSSPLAWLPLLGPFGAAAFIGYMWIRSQDKQIDRLTQVVEQQTPILIEIRDVLRSNADTQRKTTEAMLAMSEALRTRIPDAAEVIRLRDTLATLEQLVRENRKGGR